MVELSEAEREELERLREAVGDVNLPQREPISAGFEPIDPMLAETLDGPFDAVDEDDWVAETKYDGTRVRSSPGTESSGRRCSFDVGRTNQSMRYSRSRRPDS